MKTIRNERVIFVDVDETLVMHDKYDSSDCHINLIYVPDPFSVREIKVWANNPMITVLKDEKIRGATIIVWSRGGFAWAEAVVKALDIDNYVDLVMSKPLVYLDDKDIGTWLKDRVWISPDTKYKQTT